jgi:hypothetical protein
MAGIRPKEGVVEGPVRVDAPRDSGAMWGVFVFGLAIGAGITVASQKGQPAPPIEAAPPVLEAAQPPAAIACRGLGQSDDGLDPTWVVVTMRKPDRFGRPKAITAVAISRETEDTRWFYGEEFDPLWPCGKEE